MGKCWCGADYDSAMASQLNHVGYCSWDCKEASPKKNDLPDFSKLTENAVTRQPKKIYPKTVSQKKVTQLPTRYANAKKLSKRQKKFLKRLKKKRELEKLKARRNQKSDYRIKSERFLKSDEWKRLRIATLAKFGKKCLGCGRMPPAVILHVDHIKSRYYYPELALDPDNLQVLCEDCNTGKGAEFEFDFRPGNECELTQQYKAMFKK